MIFSLALLLPVRRDKAGTLSQLLPGSNQILRVSTATKEDAQTSQNHLQKCQLDFGQFVTHLIGFLSLAFLQS